MLILAKKKSVAFHAHLEKKGAVCTMWMWMRIAMRDTYQINISLKYKNRYLCKRKEKKRTNVQFAHFNFHFIFLLFIVPIYFIIKCKQCSIWLFIDAAKEHHHYTQNERQTKTIPIWNRFKAICLKFMQITWNNLCLIERKNKKKKKENTSAVLSNIYQLVCINSG